MKNLILLILIGTFLSTSGFAAANLCINDKTGKKGAKNQDINKSLEATRDPLTMAFLQTESGCETCVVAQAKMSISSQTFFASMSSVLKYGSQIKKECIEASMQREPSNVGYSCNGKTPKKFNNWGKTTPCLSQKTVDFVHYAVNQALSCMSSGRTPIDPRFILKKFNNETAFNFYIAHEGGKGIGQLTSNPVKDIAGWYEKGRGFTKGNAFHVLTELMESTNPACAPFKEIIKKDLTKPPPSPAFERNYCDWVRPGDGVARNLIYSLGYYIYMRDGIIKPALQKRAKKLADNSDVINYLTLVAYGPDGQAEALSLMQTLRLTSKTPPKQAIARIIKSNPYVNQTEKKMNELLGKLNPPSADTKGDVCVQ